ncbi:MAG TPA: polysaccharide biosynthesis/export family protein, partial [Gemmatimonadales bacterium]|nr:polysaccharide biosynthesis/export family protein [Gemmatimonadales bacterium]
MPAGVKSPASMPQPLGRAPSPGAIWRLLILALVLAAGTTFSPAGLGAQETVGGPAVTSDPGEIVRPGDLIRLKIWREPDMSGDIAVDEAGVATLPRLGAWRVANLP